MYYLCLQIAMARFSAVTVTGGRNAAFHSAQPLFSALLDS
jgi:hypothetical protein